MQLFDSNGVELNYEGKLHLINPEARYALLEGELKHLFDTETWEKILPMGEITQAQLMAWFEMSGIKWENLFLLSKLYEKGFLKKGEPMFIGG